MAKSNNSQLGNGAFYDGRVDGRGARPRRFREVMTAYIEALNREPDLIELNLLRSASALQLNLDDFEAECIRGDHTHQMEWTSAISQRDKMLRRVGILTDAKHAPPITTAGAQGDEDDD
jgi:hypothetical protein